MRRLLWLFVGLTVAGAVNWWLGNGFVRTQLHDVGAPPTSLGAEAVEIPVDQGLSVSGWFIRTSEAKASVLLLHGRGGDRRSMVPRAQALVARGYSTLLIDLPGHGESEAPYVSYGLLEGLGVASALAYLRSEVPGRPVGVIGFSLGGAAMILGPKDAIADAVVIEAVYPTIKQAVSNRMELRFGPLGRWLGPFLLWQLVPRTGARASELVPIERVGGLGAPLLVVGGVEDRRVTHQETEAMHASAGERSELWLVEGAAHEDYYRYDPEAYAAKVFEFLDRSLLDR